MMALTFRRALACRDRRQAALLLALGAATGTVIAVAVLVAFPDSHAHALNAAGAFKGTPITGVQNFVEKLKGSLVWLGGTAMSLVIAGAQTGSPAGSSPQSVAPLTAMTLTRPFPRPQARLRRVKHRLVLALVGRPQEAEVQARYLGHRGHSRQLRVLRTLHGAFTNLTLPTSGISEVSVRYVDPFDVGRSSPWTTLRLPASPSTARKARRGR